MFQKFQVLLDTPELSIEVTGEVIAIKTPNEYITCTPAEVMDSARNITYAEFENALKARNENAATVIKNWYLRLADER